MFMSSIITSSITSIITSSTIIMIIISSSSITTSIITVTTSIINEELADSQMAMADGQTADGNEARAKADSQAGSEELSLLRVRVRSV